MTLTCIVATRQVSEELQEQFAALSGDRNPIHMDPLAARRTPAGSQVVHGVHTVLWALESLVARGHIVSPVIRIKVRFCNWAYLHDCADLCLPAGALTDPGSFQVQALGVSVLTADLIYGVQTPRILDHRRMPTHVAPIPRATDLTFTQLEDRSGDAFTASPKDAAALFPHLSAFMSATAVAELTACSYIAGMECPGLHSMLSKLDLVFGKVNPAHADRVAVHYQVTDCDERFHRARIAVTGAAICGTLDVFMRTPPVKQPSMQALTARVDASEFLGMNALIIGGSRGLGELSAKLIAAGGGTPTITYVLGRTEAEQVAAHIGEWGGKADVMPYDVCLPPESQLAATAINFTHLFYFATNPIFKPKGALVSTASLAAFTTFYLHGFYNLCVQLIKSRGASGAGSQDLIAFYPSSTAIDERPLGMTEYAMVKAAGEQMCRDMNQHLPGLHIVTKRLPRIRTDQTATVIPERDVDPVTVLLPVLRGMKRLLMT